MGDELMAGEEITVEVKGLKALNDALLQLPDRIARNVLRGAVRAGAAEIRNEAKLKAPVYHGQVKEGHPPPGTLKKAIYLKQKPLSTLISQTFIVGVRQGPKVDKKTNTKDYSGDAYYWRFVEFGTVKMAAKPFLRPAFEAKKFAALKAISDYLAARIPIEVEKLPKGLPA